MRLDRGNFSFQSTLPAWGETRYGFQQLPQCLFQSTLPAWGETIKDTVAAKVATVFQSTLPAWGETFGTRMKFCTIKYFNPLSPHGERHKLESEEQKK